MSGELVEIRLWKPRSKEMKNSFNGDVMSERIDYFGRDIPACTFNQEVKESLPFEYLRSNVYQSELDQIYQTNWGIFIGQYSNHGLIVPSGTNIAFDQLYNCSPLISRIEGEEEYISFLHTWAIAGDSEIVDRQVEHWMETVSEFGNVLETIFAPRENSNRGGSDTNYGNAVKSITERSKKTIVLIRDVYQIEGIVNEAGVYFKHCGYHLWER